VRQTPPSPDAPPCAEPQAGEARGPLADLAPGALEGALLDRFGLSSFREGQRDVVEAILRGEDALVVRPTGSGKSLCYQLPALLARGVTVVVSPLISLMKDQCDALAAKGMPAVAIHSGQSMVEAQEAMASLRSGRARLCYVAPERFRVPRFMEALAGLDVGLLAVDEAHCVSEWGHEFRPDYRRLGEARKVLGNPVVAAFTATATAQVRRDILDELGIPKHNIFVSGFDRPNLHFEVEKHAKREEKLERLRDLKKELGPSGAGIVYCATRKSAQEVALSLGGERKGVGMYHAGLDPAARRRVQEAFMADELRVLVATNAFGMGIDRPDIRFVAHAEMPRSLEAYYQEAGRAGRDGKPARCVLLFGRADRIVHEFLIEESTPEQELVERVWRALKPEDGPGPRPWADVETIAEKASPRGPRGGKPRALATESALKLLEKAGHISLGHDRESRAAVIEVRDVPPKDGLQIEWTLVLGRRSFEMERLSKVGRYAEGAGCRTRAILNYFGDRTPMANGRCGHCDACNAAPPEIAKVASDPPAARPRGAPPAGSDNMFHVEQGAPAARVAQKQVSSSNDDATTVARKVLACVARMGGGAARADAACCLTGSRAPALLAQGHDRLSTYGILRDRSHEHVLAWVDAIARAGLLASEGARVALTPKGIEVMAGRAPLPPLEGLPGAAGAGASTGEGSA